MGASETDRKLRKARLIFYEDDVERINKALENYQNLSKSRCNMLIDVVENRLVGHGVPRKWLVGALYGRRPPRLQPSLRTGSCGSYT